MPQVLNCSQCGGLLNEDYVCAFCGARYEKPTDTDITYNVNIVNNYGNPLANVHPAVTPNSLATQVPTPPPAAGLAITNTDVDTEAAQEQPTAEKESTNQTDESTAKVKQCIEDNGAQLCIYLIIALVGVVWGILGNHDWMVVVGLIFAALFGVCSKPLGGKKK